MTVKDEVKTIDENSKYRIDSLNAELNQLKTQNTLIQEKLDAAEKELAAEKQTKSEEIIAKRVMDRAELLQRAAPYLGNINNYVRSPDREIMIAAMNANRTDANDFKDRSDDFIKGAFDHFVSIDNRTDSENINIFNVVAKRQDSMQYKSIHDQFMNLING